MRNECRAATGKPKFKYWTRAEANAKIRRVGDATMQPYRCGECDYFHIGHYPKDRRTRSAMRDVHRSMVDA